jgi:tetratricopeptide (TPR) repeat protein
MTEHEFAELLSRQESDILDFKANQYDFSGTGEEKRTKRARFVKDIICLANTPRKQAAHIILGVKSHPDGTKDLKGITDYVDDADLQTRILKWVHPHPHFTYEPVTHKDKTYGMITVPPVRDIGPYYCIHDNLGKFLQPNKLYFRKGTRNSTANQEEQKAVYAWFLETGHHEVLSCVGPVMSTWDSFMQSVDCFDPRRSLVLALSPLSPDLTTKDLSALAGLDWFFVADFDTTSAHKGAFDASREIIETRRAIHLITKGDLAKFSPRNATYWYFARGIEGRDDTLATGKWLDWHRAYSRDVREKVDELARVVPRPITIFAIWYSSDLIRHLNTFLETVLPPLGSGVEIVIASDEGDAFKTMAEEYGAEVTQIPLHHLIAGLKEHSAERLNRPSDAVVIPSSSGSNIELEQKVVRWIEEDLEIVHLNLGKRPPVDTSDLSQFLRGKPISWFELALHVDVERDIQTKLQSKVNVLLQERRSVRVNLYHEPGAGGSTLARRIVWHFRKDHPCVILHRCHPKQTIERLQRLFSLTSNPLIILVEGNTLSDQQSDELAGLLSARNIPAVMLQVIRRFEKPGKLSENSLHMESILSDGELYRFESVLCRDVPNRASIIKKTVSSKNDVERTPFYLGLVAFEKDFVSLQKYVSLHLQQLNDLQRKALTYFSLALYYGQLPLDSQMFAGLFGLPPSKPVDMANVFSEYTLRLLVKTDAVSWRPAHQLIADEFLQQTLSFGLEDSRLWRIRLCDVAIEFAEFCAHCDGDSWDRVTDLLQRVFIYRDETEILGKEYAGSKLFARIITEMPYDESRLRVFLRLTELYPENSHFWAHLGRFYSNQIGEHDKGIEAIDKALAIWDQDHVIHHMNGMVYRNWAYDEMRKSAPLDEVISLAKLASECFSKAREVAPDDDYGYISEVQIITKVLDYGAIINEKPAILAAAHHPDSWFREGFDTAENLLEDVRRKRQSESESEYEIRCRAELDLLYGKHGEALQTWQNLLDRRTVYAPPIRRQIIRTMLARSHRRWENMTDRDIERSLELLQNNIAEEPNDGRNIRIWLQALRTSKMDLPIENIIEKVAYWASASESLDAHYYLYILYSLLAIDGSSIAVERSESFIEKCRVQARYRRDKTKSYEWLGLEKGLKGLVHQNALGSWDNQTNFWQDTKLLRRQEGIITRIRGPEAGTIAVSGLKAFFVPGVSAHAHGEAENRKVTFFLGFSFDGLRAWSVEDAL